MSHSLRWDCENSPGGALGESTDDVATLDFGRDVFRRIADLRHGGRRAGDRRRARPVGAEPVRRGVGVAFLDGLIDVIAGGGGLLVLPALLSAGLPPTAALAINKLQGVHDALNSFLVIRAAALVEFAEMMLAEFDQSWEDTRRRR